MQAPVCYGGVKVVMELHWSSTEKVCKFGHRGIDTRTTTPSRAMALNSIPLVWGRSFSPRFCKKKNKDGISCQTGVMGFEPMI